MNHNDGMVWEQVSDLPAFLNQVLERFPLLTDLSMMRNPACPGLMDIQRPDMEACRLYRTYVVFRAPQLITVDGVDVTDKVINLFLYLCPWLAHCAFFHKV